MGSKTAILHQRIMRVEVAHPLKKGIVCITSDAFTEVTEERFQSTLGPRMLRNINA